MSWWTTLAAWRLQRAIARAPRVGSQTCMRCKASIEEWCGRCPLHGYVCFRCMERKPFRSSVWCPTCHSPLQQCTASGA
ncbi:MAG: hypothetical protein NT062_31030 [Proteobacteria bacterium]|nr:hypothetical protein [Pseudomonadota bacterium]